MEEQPVMQRMQAQVQQWTETADRRAIFEEAALSRAQAILVRWR